MRRWMRMLPDGRRRWRHVMDYCNTHCVCSVNGETSQPRLGHPTAAVQDASTGDQHRPRTSPPHHYICTCIHYPLTSNRHHLSYDDCLENKGRLQDCSCSIGSYHSFNPTQLNSTCIHWQRERCTRVHVLRLLTVVHGCRVLLFFRSTKTRRPFQRTLFLYIMMQLQWCSSSSNWNNVQRAFVILWSLPICTALLFYFYLFIINQNSASEISR